MNETQIEILTQVLEEKIFLKSKKERLIKAFEEQTKSLSEFEKEVKFINFIKFVKENDLIFGI